jgi:hypothetical protein
MRLLTGLNMEKENYLGTIKSQIVGVQYCDDEAKGGEKSFSSVSRITITIKMP